MIIINDQEVIQILQDHSDVYESNNFFAYPFRWLGWKLIQGLNALVSGIEGAVKEIFQNLNFFEGFSANSSNPEMEEFMKTIRPIYMALLLIGVVIIGYQIMFNRQKEKSQILINVILFFGIVGGIGSFASQLSDITSASADALLPSTSYSSTGDETIKAGITDLVYIDNNNPQGTQCYTARNDFNNQNLQINPLDFIDPNALMKPDECTNSKLFENRVEIDASGTAVLKELGDGKGLFGIGSDVFSQYYYRYSIDWSTVIVSLLVLAISLLLTAIKMAKIIFEIGYNIIFILFVAPLDLHSGQRTKKCLQEILSLFLVLIAIALMYRVYFYGMTWTNTTFQGNGFAKLLVQIGMSWALIDGPNIVQKILGIDAGLGSVFSALSNMYYATQMAKTAVSAAGKVAKAGAKVAGKAAGFAAKEGAFVAGHAAGMYDHLKNSKKGSDDKASGGIWGGKQLQSAEKPTLPSSDSADGKHGAIGTPDGNPKSPDSGGGSPHDTESNLKDSKPTEQNAMHSNTENSQHSQGADDHSFSAESLHTQDSNQDSSSEQIDTNSDKGESIHSSDTDNTSTPDDKSQGVDNNVTDSNGLYSQGTNSVSSENGESNHPEVQSANKSEESLHSQSQGQSDTGKQNSQEQNKDNSESRLHSGSVQPNGAAQTGLQNTDSKSISGQTPNLKHGQNAGTNSNEQAINKKPASHTMDRVSQSDAVPTNSDTRPIGSKSGSSNTLNSKSTQDSGATSSEQGVKSVNSNAQSVSSNESIGHSPSSKSTHESGTASGRQTPSNHNASSQPRTAQSISNNENFGHTPISKSTHESGIAFGGQTPSNHNASSQSGTAQSNSASQYTSGRSHFGNAAHSTTGNTQQTNQSNTASTGAATQYSNQASNSGTEQQTNHSGNTYTTQQQSGSGQSQSNTQTQSGNAPTSSPAQSTNGSQTATQNNVSSRLNSLTADIKSAYHSGYDVAKKSIARGPQIQQFIDQTTTKVGNKVNPHIHHNTQSQSYTPTPDISNTPKLAKPKFNPFRRNRKNKKGGKK